MSEQLQFRFRHTQGDVGPLSLPVNLTVQQTKERLFEIWPKGWVSPNTQASQISYLTYGPANRPENIAETFTEIEP